MFDFDNKRISSEVFTKLIAHLTEQALRDFQQYIGDRFEIPTSLWLSKDNNELDQIHHEERYKYYSPFCLYLEEIGFNTKRESYCHDCDKKTMAAFLKDPNTLNDVKISTIIPCPMKLSRIVFPLKIDNKIIGSLVVGKFIQNEAQKQEIKEMVMQIRQKKICPSSFSKINDQRIIEITDTMLRRVDSLPIFSETAINDLRGKISLLLPLLKSHYSHMHYTDPKFDKIIFLDHLEEETSTVTLSEDEFWEKIDIILQDVIKKLRLKTAIVFYSDNENYQLLIPKVVIPRTFKSVELFSFQNPIELQELITAQRGTVLPDKSGKFPWLTREKVKQIFDADDAIIYGKNVFAGKVVIIGFGFQNDIYLDRFERLILKESVNRLFKFINNVLSTLELDHIMAESGHMLQRACSSIKSGIDTLEEIAYFEERKEPGEYEGTRRKAKHAIDSGLFRLDLIIKNHFAFRTLRGYTRERYSIPDDKSLIDKDNYVDILDFIKKTMKNYQYDLRRDNKEIKIEPLSPKIKVIGDKDLIELMILNLLDNAIKYSYSNRKIIVSIEKLETFYSFSISNFGVGIAQDELVFVFQRYYQSRFKDTSKKRVGTGSGLAIAKRVMDIFFSEGSIAINSYPSEEEKRFPGDRYTTTVTLNFPKALVIED